jgi:hypothetical protein
MSYVLEEVRQRLFPDGEQICSAQALSNLFFQYAGELMAMTIAHGGPSPSLLKEWVSDYFANVETLEMIVSVKPSIDDLKCPGLKSFVSQVCTV